MSIIIYFLIRLLDVYLWLIIGSVIVSWLVVFDVLNTRNRWVSRFLYILNRLTEPGMALLRRVIPPIGGIDLSPMVMMIGISLVQGFLSSLLRS